MCLASILDEDLRVEIVRRALTPTIIIRQFASDGWVASTMNHKGIKRAQHIGLSRDNAIEIVEHCLRR